MPRRCGVAAHAGHSISATGFITNASAHLRTVRRVMSSADGPTGKPAIVDLRRAPRKRSRLQGLGALWGDSAIRDDHGRPLPVLRNVTIALRSAPAVAEAFSFDELEQLIIVKDHLPLAAGAEPRNITPPPRPLTDVDVSQLQEWLQFVGLPRIGAAIVHQAIALRAQERSFHPFRSYLNSVVWDGRPRLGTWLARYLGAKSRPYTDEIGAMFLTAAVARVLEPGCQADYALVLEGPQEVGKSRHCKVLGGDWFSDTLPNVSRDKDTAQHIRGKWFVEISELSALSRAEIEQIKSFLSRRVNAIARPTAVKNASNRGLAARRNNNSSNLPQGRDRRTTLLASAGRPNRHSVARRRS